MKKEISLLGLALILFSGCAILDDPDDKKDLITSESMQEKKIGETIQDRHWKRVFSKAFSDVACPSSRDPQTLPDGYYKGPMLDTHVHIQSLPDGEPGYPDTYYVGDNLGIRRSISEWICMVDVEGTKQAWVFFPVWDPIVEESVDVVTKTIKKYPDRFIPFIMPPDGDGPTVAAQALQEMLDIEPGLFKGYGEIGLYATSELPSLPPDSEKMMEIYRTAEKNNLIVYVHLGEGHQESLERAAEANPNVTFVFHGDQLIDCGECDRTPDAVAQILERHPNVYYGVDELYGNEWLLKPGAGKRAFLDHFADYERLLQIDLANWKDFIESHPDQVLWGTDRGVSETWDTDTDVALTLNNYTRAFIGRLDSSVQEKYAYRNAEKLLGK